MSAAKVIFTYKRKRLSSRSGVGHEDGCTDLSLDDQVDKLQDNSNKKIKCSKKDFMIIKCAKCSDVECSMSCASCIDSSDSQCLCYQLQHASCGEEMEATRSAIALQNSSRLGENCDVQRSDTADVKNIVLASNELPGDNTLKISSESFSAGASIGKITSFIEKDSCLPHSSYLDVEGREQGGSVIQSLENGSNPFTIQVFCSNTEVAKGQSNAPLLTFRRRLKRKADVYDKHMFTKLPPGAGDATIRECDLRPVLSCMCDGVLRESRLAENPVNIRVERNDVDIKNMLKQNSAKMISNEIGGSSSPCCAQPSTETLTMRQKELASTSGEGLVVDASPVNKKTEARTSGSIASALHHPDTVGVCTTDDQPVSQHFQASSGDSQPTSSGSSDLKLVAAKKVEHGARSNSVDLSCPPPGAFVIDCNVVPESDVQEDASDIIQESLTAKNNEKMMQKGHMKSKSLELFGDDSKQVEDSPDGVCTSIKTTIKPETKYLQLFSEDEKCSQCTPSNTFSVSGDSKAHQNATFTLDSQWHKVDQSSSKASPVLGLSLPTELMHEGQMSKEELTIHQFQNPNVSVCNLIQNPAIQSFPNQASSRHKQLLESINTRATSLRGNRNISLDKFEPYPSVWSEEELDSLWIGIRRHGRGNWHAMILDPRLRFAPWRMAGDLEKQWEQEQHRLFSGQHMQASRCLKPQDAYKLPCHGPVVCRGTGGRRENSAAETQLSLGDVYAQKDGITFKTSVPTYGMAQAQRHVTMASCSAASYGCGLFNNFQTRVMISNEVSSDGPAMAFGMNNCLPHWHRDPTIIPSKPLDLPLPPVPTPSQMGGFRLFHAFPETSCKEMNHDSTNFAGVHPPKHLRCNASAKRKPGTADNLIVIDSDASSEETISDDNNNNSNNIRS